MTKIAQALLVSAMSVAVLTACGGGGGGNTTAPAPAPLPTLSVAITSPASGVSYAGRSVSLSANATSSANLTANYSWDFGDGTTGSGSAATHAFSKAGTYAVTVTASDTNGTKAQSTVNLVIVDVVLDAPTITSTGQNQVAGTEVSFTGASKDPSAPSAVLTYTWDFGDASSTTGASVKHSFQSGGEHFVTLTVKNDLGNTAKSTLSFQVTPLPGSPSYPSVTPSLANTFANNSVGFTAAASDPAQLALTYAWNFGDGATATGASVSHTYASAGMYNVRVVATNSKGLSSSTTKQYPVMQQVSNPLVVGCSGTGCASTGATSYAGSGVGIWQYKNAGATDAVADFSIAGVKSGQVATLVFTNPDDKLSLAKASAGAIPVAPLLAQLAPTSSTVAARDEHADHDSTHSLMRFKNQELLKLQRANPLALNPVVRAENVPSVKPVAIGDTKVWIDTFNSSSPVSYNLKVSQICKLKTGRNAVFWADPNGGATASDIQALANTFCLNGGAGTGGFDVLTDTMGDAYGTKSYTNTITDANGLLDINVVLPNVPASTGWGGYFWGGNNYLKTAYSSTKNSNEALVFFVNGPGVTRDLNYYKSTLMHEAVHMINFYQRGLVRNTDHDTWLEETTAMMGEDILAKTIFTDGFNKMTSVRIPDYLKTGGGVSYVNWPDLSSDNYAFGGAFGAFLNRKYGASLFKNLVTSCNDGSATGQVSSYSCLNTLILNAGGLGIADELTKFGASIWSNLPTSGLPVGYGFPQRTVDGNFNAIDVLAISKSVPIKAKAFANMAPTTHYFAQETIAAGKSSYAKTNVIVPAGATLHVVIRD
ncbi:PKD domain-containing protein [Undibacterium sp. CY7W]|uniref:PKD domain-containing protein n=1 Tax=Undibacterium rugosum TaxID=2762291 RepID=A0A923I321_9BURK|nr:PKD domain-containing protein [Undibacterium rugosum]MBC3934526.1 PKD domain-containing protein [Undibacterium rugosum]